MSVDGGGESSDGNAPLLGPLFKVVPRELPGKLRFKLVVQRSWRMVADNGERCSYGKRVDECEYSGMTHVGRKAAHIQDVSLFGGCIYHNDLSCGQLQENPECMAKAGPDHTIPTPDTAAET